LLGMTNQATFSAACEAAPSREPFMRWLLDGAEGSSEVAEAMAGSRDIEDSALLGTGEQEWQGRKQDGQRDRPSDMYHTRACSVSLRTRGWWILMDG
jgi:hypothetical protein